MQGPRRSRLKSAKHLDSLRDVLGLVTGRYLDAYRCGADTQSRRPKRSLVLALGTLILNGKLPKTRNETYDGDFPVLAIGNMPDLRELWGLGQSW